MPQLANETASNVESALQRRDDGKLPASAIIGISVGALLLGVVIGGWLVCRACVKKGESKRRTNLELAGVPAQRKLDVETVHAVPIEPASRTEKV